jgi:PAS domain S-box-containing protein
MNFSPNILVIEGAINNFPLIKTILSDKKVNLIQANSNIEDLDKIPKITFALAIIDITISEMNSLELVLKIIEEKSNEKVPILFITNSVTDNIEIMEGYNTGAIDYIFRPINNLMLKSKILLFINLFTQKQKLIANSTLLKKSRIKLTQTNKALNKSIKKHKNYIENDPDAVFVTDKTGKILEANQAMLQITGYSEKELLKLSLLHLLSKDSDQANWFKSKLSSRELLIKHKSGTNHSVSIKDVKLSQNKFLFFIKNKAPKEEIINLGGYLKTITKNLSIGIYYCNTDGKFLYINKKLEEITGYKQDEITSNNLLYSSFLSLKDTRKALKLFTLTILGKHPKSQFFTLNGEGKTQKHVEISHLRMNIKGEDIIMGMVTELAEKINSKNQRKKKTYQLRDTFEDITKRTTLEEKYKVIQETSIDSFCITDLSGHLLDVNNPFIAMMGYTKKELLTKTLQDLENKNNSGAINQIIERVIQTGTETSEVEQQNKKGEVLEVLVSVTYNSRFNGRLYVFFHNNTDKNITDKILKLSEQKYNTMLNASPDGIILINNKGIIIEVSEIGLELFGFNNKEELHGKHYLYLVAPEEKNIIKEVISKTIDEGINQNIEVKFKRRNKSFFPGEISTTLIQEPLGEPFFFMITVRDITTRKKMEEKMIHADRMASLGEMASGIAHEINQPLNTVSLIMDNVLREVTENKNTDKSYLAKKTDKVFDNIIRIRNIIDHIRAFSRDQSDYISASFDVNSSINNAINMIAEQLKHYSINLILQLDHNLSLIIGNTFTFEQVILNLLSNSKDALLEKNSQNSLDYDMFIKITSFMENEYLIIEVVDNGKGIKKEDIENVTLPFYTTKETGKGTGLGLSISYRIIKELGGTIELEPNTFKGTTVRISLKVLN